MLKAFEVKYRGIRIETHSKETRTVCRIAKNPTDAFLQIVSENSEGFDYYMLIKTKEINELCGHKVQINVLD